MAQYLGFAETPQKYLLGAILSDIEAKVELPHIKSVWFDERGSKIVTAANELFLEGKEISLLTLVQKLKGQVAPVEIAALSSSYTGGENIKTVIEVCAREYNTKLLNTRLQELAAADIGLEKKLTQVGELMALAGFSESREPVSSNKIANKYIDKVSIAHQNGETLTGLTTTWRNLDNVIGGYNPSDLIIIAGRPGMGKTALALSLSNQAAKAGHKVLFVSLEMSSEQLIKRWLSLETGIDAGVLNRGKLYQNHIDSLVQYSLTDRSAIFIDDETSLSLGELVAKIRRHKAKHGLEVLFVDYIQLIKSVQIKGRTREQEVAEISRTMKLLAKDLGITVVALAQLSRGIENRGDKRPMLSDLRESGAIEQDADVIIFPYRPNYYAKDEADGSAEEAELVIGKNRHGEAPILNCVFTPFLARYSEF